MESLLNKKIGGMKKPSWWKKHDPRRFKWEKKFGGLLRLSNANFDVYNYTIVKDQLGTEICQSEGVAYSQEAIFKQPIDEGFQRAATNARAGKAGDSGPADPYDADHGAITIGSIPKANAPYPITDSRIYDLKNYSDYLIEAKTFTEISSYDVQLSNADIFDSICNTLNQSLQSPFPIPIRVGCKWYASWLNAPGGIIDYIPKNESYTYHEFTIIGQRSLLDGILRLRGILSSGEDVGDKGKFYFSRAVANTFMFSLAFGQGSPNDYKQFQWGILAKAVDWLMNILKSLKH